MPEPYDGVLAVPPPTTDEGLLSGVAGWVEEKWDGLQETYETITSRDPRIRLVDALATESPAFSESSNAAIGAIRSTLDGMGAARVAVVAGAVVVDLVSQPRQVPKVGPLKPPKVSPSGKAAKSRVLQAVEGADKATLGEIRRHVETMVIQDQLTPEERNYWQNLRDLVKGAP